MKTYFLRYKAQCSNALKVAEHLESHPQVTKVLYPGLPSHPDFELAQKQLEDSGVIVSINLAGGAKAREVFFEKTKIFQFTSSLGGTESLIAPSKIFYSGGLTEEEQERAGILEGTVRLSVGLEHVDDLIADLDQALNY
jgi:cystathionine beta-lyase/cystathionine gamma-synthase